MINLLRTAAGIESLEHLSDVQRRFRTILADNGARCVFISTRRKPQRSDELLNGGSVYWIVKHMIRARQEIVDIKIFQDDEGRDFCQIYLDPQIILTQGISHRAIQGWRYFDKAKAPADIGPYDPSAEMEDDIPEDMVQELKSLGLL